MSLSESQHEESFNNMSIYLHNLRKTNSLTYTHIKTNLIDHFEACFVAIGWCPCKRDYLKTMFVAVAIDMNNQTLPIAFGLTMENNLYCCTRFLMRLREALRQGKEVLFITNIEHVISSCMKHVFPNSYYGYTLKVCSSICTQEAYLAKHYNLCSG
uniref:MULE transposase domain-containing protein n=1 Tax=Lactuca sativa TaxID=4236 RepID=A0A9R1X8N2_LACSA|nr:hypothetical protein LSAT_V11C600311660 [Lactuca sativa]